MKKCYKCKIFKELSEFWKDKQKRDELKPVCKNCNYKYIRKGYSHTHQISGWNHSEETKRKIGLAHKDKKRKPFTEETRKKMSKARLGIKYSKETIEKIRQARLKQIIPNKDTSIEIKLQNWLKKQNIEFETHYPILGQPDIFIKPNICIFADGCYWHKCEQCGFGHLVDRDKEITQELQEQGYLVIRIWEHDINSEFN